MIFFFQAEDGIRDGHVTGVQTCALPIFTVSGAAALLVACGDSKPKADSTLAAAPDTVKAAVVSAPDTRSEERRVGKESRNRSKLNSCEDRCIHQNSKKMTTITSITRHTS